MQGLVGVANLSVLAELLVRPATLILELGSNKEAATDETTTSF
jgi:hypothetical protein